MKTQQKLLDIKAAAATVGIQDLNVIHNTITTGTGHNPANGSFQASFCFAARLQLTVQSQAKAVAVAKSDACHFWR